MLLPLHKWRFTLVNGNAGSRRLLKTGDPSNVVQVIMGGEDVGNLFG